MTQTLVFEIVDIFCLSSGNGVLMCTPDKFTKPVVTKDNQASIKIGDQNEKPITILGEDIHVRQDVNAPVKYSNFQTSENVEYLKESLGNTKLILTITY